MPFDLSPEFDPLVFTPGREGLRKLAWVLRHPETWPKHEWNFGTIYESTSCGTVGCAMGLAAAMWPEHIGARPCTAILEDALGIPEPALEKLFVSAPTEYYGGKRFTEIEPKDVADAIDSYLAKAPQP